MMASVGAWICGSGRSSTRTSPAPYITTPRIRHSLPDVTDGRPVRPSRWSSPRPRGAEFRHDQGPGTAASTNVTADITSTSKLRRQPSTVCGIPPSALATPPHPRRRAVPRFGRPTWLRHALCNQALSDRAADSAAARGNKRLLPRKSQIHAGSHIMCAPNNAPDGAISVRTSSHRCRGRPQRPPANVPHYSAQGRDGIRGAGGRDVGE